MFTAFAALSVTKIGKPNANTVKEQNHEYQRFCVCNERVQLINFWPDTLNAILLPPASAGAGLTSPRHLGLLVSLLATPWLCLLAGPWSPVSRLERGENTQIWR
mgnify:CR=1 FL=1